MKNKKLFIMLALLVIGIVVFCAVINLNNKKHFEKDFNSLLSLREKLITEIMNNEIEIDENKFAKLPEEYEQVAANGRVRILMNSNEETLIEFLYRAGFPDEAQYIYYSNKDDKFIKEQVGEISCNYIERIIEDWYFVQYN